MTVSNKLIEHGPGGEAALLDAYRTTLIVIDVQEKLIPTICYGERIVDKIVRLGDAARLFDVPRIVTEQYPRGLGKTIATLAAPPLEKGSPLQDSVHEKTTFSLRGCEDLWTALTTGKRRRVLLCGIETHICVLQSALDLVAGGLDVTVVVDAVGSRNELDHEIGLRRLERAEVRLVTTEMVLFEWCRDSRHPAFKEMQALVRQMERPT